jgi:serine/threonine-protein kinase
MSRPEPRDERRPNAATPTLFLPQLAERSRTDSFAGWTPTPELRDQITRRLQLVGIMYSLAFLFADFVPSMLMGGVQHYFYELSSWIAPITAIVAGVVVATVVRSPRLSWQNKLVLGLAFEVLGSYGIAIAQYIAIPDLSNQPAVLYVLSPSWVAVWIMFFSVIVPAPPHKTLVALILSASAPVIVLWYSIHAHKLAHLIPPGAFVLHHALPYAICAFMAYAAARVVYKLGAAVTRAQELGSYRLVERLGSGGMGECGRRRTSSSRARRRSSSSGPRRSPALTRTKRRRCSSASSSKRSRPHR